MKRFYSFAAAMGTAVLASAQLVGVSIEPVMTHDGTTVIPAQLFESPDTSYYECGPTGTLFVDVDNTAMCEYPTPDLIGYTTYHIYADLTTSTDFVSAVYGTEASPMILECTGEIYQSPGVNFNYANEVNPLFFPLAPYSTADSWLTIGSEDANGGVDIQNAGDSMAPALTSFNAGEGFTIDDDFGGSWFTLFPCTQDQPLDSCDLTNLAFGGEDNRVLLAQITATGDVHGIMNVQIFPNGVQVDQQQVTGQTFSTNDMDVFGCTNPNAFNYNESATLDDLSCVLPCTVSLNVDNVNFPTCNGQNDASIYVSATGAQGADYFYINAIDDNNYDLLGNFTNLLADTYTVYVVDGVGCTDSLVLEVPVTEEVQINAELTTGLSCHDGQDAVLTVTETTGGSGMYEYYISNNPSMMTTQTEWTGLSGNQTLSVYAMDSNGCLGESNSVFIANPTPISVGFQSPTANVVDATCANSPDGQIFLAAFGGSAPLTIEFSVDSMNYGPSPLMVAGGTYTVTAQDVFGCIGVMEQEVVVGPDAIDINLMSTPAACFGGEDGEVSWAPEGGEGMYTYAFNGEVTLETSVSDLAPGTYEVAVTDEEGCTETASIEVEDGVEITAAAESTDASCFGEEDGEVEVFAEGGTGSFQFSDDGNTFDEDNEFDDLLAGTYTFFIQDENGCVASLEATIGEPEAIVVTGIVSEGSVTGEGFIDVTVTGGSMPYTYEWIGEGVSGQDNQDLEGISTGSYTVDVTDSNGCTVTFTFNITTDIHELSNDVKAAAFPNPSQGQFVVEIQGGYQGKVNFQVLDSQGRQIESGQWIANSGTFRTILDLAGHEAGIYRLVLIADGRPSSLQLVKTH